MTESIREFLDRIYGGEAEWLLVRPGGSRPVAGSGDEPPPVEAPIYSGSFRPLHAAHRALFDSVCIREGACCFEVSIENFTKGRHPRDQVAETLAQFAGWAPVLVTARPTFRGKAELLEGRPTFAMGADVFDIVLANPPWPEARFLVANRAHESPSGLAYPSLEDRFGGRADALDWEPLDLPRIDISSTALREGGEARGRLTERPREE